MKKASCSIPDCCRPHHAKGYCHVHHERFLKHGDPLGGRLTFNGDPLRFIHEVALLHTSEECLIWPFGKNSKGYGTIKVERKTAISSRYICELAHGAPPTPEHEAAHSCGKGHEGCIAPGHLEWKTHAENMSDTLAHGTHTRGERNAHAKLTEADVREILALRGRESQRKLAERFGVSYTTVGHIHVGRRWAWLKESIGKNDASKESRRHKRASSLLAEQREAMTQALRGRM